MTRRERLERKAERRREWAAGARTESAQRFDAAHRIADGIPLGQPILVGHHSEKHHRRDVARIDSNMRKGSEAYDRAQHHESKAAGLEAALETNIYSDDANAVEALEARIAEREAHVARLKALNVALRRELKAGGGTLQPGWSERIGATPEELKRIESNVRFGSYSGTASPCFPGYHLTNLNARIRADRERLVMVKARQTRAAQAEADGGVSIERGLAKGSTRGYCRVTFADKPAREVLDELKAAGFWWKNGSWCGPEDQLPARFGAPAAPAPPAPAAELRARHAAEHPECTDQGPDTCPEWAAIHEKEGGA